LTEAPVGGPEDDFGIMGWFCQSTAASNIFFAPSALQHARFLFGDGFKPAYS